MSKKSIFRSDLKICETFPTHEDFFADLGSELCLIYDRELTLKVKDFKHWIRAFPCTLEVKSGEDLKSVENFSENIKRILHLTESFSRKNLVLVAVGGGTVGDFVGFVASILRRGVRFVQVPTTWLAAIDSAHGGKTALNVEGAKNQLGTFYPPEKIYFIKKFFEQNSAAFSDNALGELVKIALIDGDTWSKELLESQESAERLFNQHYLSAVKAKRRIVDLDPYEKIGTREVLNLGHTVGHVVESLESCPHGVAICKGILFSLEWSRHKELLADPEYRYLKGHLQHHFKALLKKYPNKIMNSAQFLALLSRDKKLRSKAAVNFIFIRGLGQVEVLPINLSLVLQEAIRQGWVKA